MWYFGMCLDAVLLSQAFYLTPSEWEGENLYIFLHFASIGGHVHMHIPGWDVWNRCDRQHETKGMNPLCSGGGNGRNGAAGQEGLWLNSKESFPDFIKPETAFLPRVLNSPQWTTRLRFLFMDPILFFYSHSPVFFLFFIFPITALAELQRLSFFIGLLTLQTALQHSWARIMPPPHLCVYTTPCPLKSSDTLYKDLPGTSSPSFLLCI